MSSRKEQRVQEYFWTIVVVVIMLGLAVMTALGGA